MQVCPFSYQKKKENKTKTKIQQQKNHPKPKTKTIYHFLHEKRQSYMKTFLNNTCLSEYIVDVICHRWNIHCYFTSSLSSVCSSLPQLLGLQDLWDRNLSFFIFYIFCCQSQQDLALKMLHCTKYTGIIKFLQHFRYHMSPSSPWLQYKIYSHKFYFLSSISEQPWIILT